VVQRSVGSVPGVTSVKRLAGAAVLGVGALLGSRRRDQHWSETPVLEVVEEEHGGASGGDLDDPALVVVERRLAAVEATLESLTGDRSLRDLAVTGDAGSVKELEGRMAALLDAGRAVRRGHDARLAVGVTVASWETSLRLAQQQGRQWLAYRWGGAEELAALATDLEALDVAPDDA
jgi:hypothetical protein